MITKLLLASVFSIVPLIAIAAAAGSELFLSESDIDLLVGTPTGVKEPLDSRRTKYSQTHDDEFINLLDEDFYINDSVKMPDWQDAEEKQPTSSEIEGEYLDLLSETGADIEESIIENQNATSSCEIFKEQIETEQEL